jgi:CP family cyanate transporter-like MFS transporter
MRWLLLSGLWLSYLSFGVTAASIAPLVATIRADLDLTNSAIGSIMGAWQLVYIVSAIPCGILLDRLGPRIGITIGIVLIALSAAGRAMADDYWSLLAAVMLFGLGGPIISSGAPKVVASIFSGANRGLAMGIYMTGPTLGGIAALTLTHPVLLPLLEGSWRSVMMVWAAVAVVVAVAWVIISHVASRRFRTALAPAPAIEAGAGENAGGVRGILRIPGVPLVLMMSIGVFLYNHGLNNWLPELLRSGGMDATTAGFWAALPMLVGIIGSLTIPRLATPKRRFKILGGLCILAALATVALQFQQPVVLTGALILQGLVRAAMMTVLILTLMELPGMNPRQTGTASGMFFSAAEVGGVMGPLGIGLLYDTTGGFSASLYALTAVAIMLALATARLATSSRKT